jgi:hypothetical protein
LLVPDHLIVWGDVERVGALIERDLGLDPADGGIHPGLGTRNVLFAMDHDRFLEVLGPDPGQPSRGWGPAADHPEGTLWWWAARTGSDLRTVRERLAALGVGTDDVRPGSRLRPSGERLAWETVDPTPEPFGVALPFVIRWRDDPPLRGRERVCTLRSLTLSHPEPVALAEVVAAVGLGTAVEVVAGPRPGLSATIEGPVGTMELATP